MFPQVRIKPQSSPTACADSQIITFRQIVAPPGCSLYLAEMLCAGSQPHTAQECPAREHLLDTVGWVGTNQIHPAQKAGPQLVPEMKSGQSKPGRARLGEIIKQNRGIYLP